MASRKRSLTALPFNCGPQQTDNIIVIKDNYSKVRRCPPLWTVLVRKPLAFPIASP